MSGRWSEAELAHMKWRKAQKEKEKEEARERTRRKLRSRSSSRGRRSRFLSSDRGSPKVGSSPPPDPKRPEVRRTQCVIIILRRAGPCSFT